jgi:hypothetical protein
MLGRDMICDYKIINFLNDDETINTRYYIYKKGYKHRENGPAFIQYAQDGSIISKSWYLYDILTKREVYNNNQTIIYNIYGPIYSQEHFENGFLSNRNGPASILYHREKRIYERFYVNGKLL